MSRPETYVRDGYGWPRAIARCEPSDAPRAISELRAAHHAAWKGDRNRGQPGQRNLMAFLQIHYPQQWERIRDCRTRHFTFVANQGAKEVEIVLEGCGVVPFCPACNSEGTIQRATDRLRAFSRCTPKGEDHRLRQVNIAGYTDENGRGWGTAASREIAEFAKVCWEALEWAFGNGTGCAMSYHDISEQGWHKPHPHYDITFNGWAVTDDGKPYKTRVFRLLGGGRKRLENRINDAARERGWDVASDHFVNLDLRPLTVGFWRYYKAIRYQVREIVDPRKIQFDPKADTVTWRTYVPPSDPRWRPPRPMPTTDFKRALREYATRLQPWGSRGRRPLDRVFGHMADRAIRTTQEAMGGGAIEHYEDCGCQRCREWRRVRIPDLEERVGEGRSIEA